jgi:hypothetical protein
VIQGSSPSRESAYLPEGTMKEFGIVTMHGGQSANPQRRQGDAIA